MRLLARSRDVAAGQLGRRTFCEGGEAHGRTRPPDRTAGRVTGAGGPASGSISRRRAPPAGRVGTWTVDGIDPTRIPTHVAASWTATGAGRSAGLKRTEGHAAGEEALFDTVEGALELGVEWLTVYAFSTENWQRPADEVRYLMDFNESLLLRRRDELNERGVRMRFIGRRDWRGARSGSSGAWTRPSSSPRTTGR